MRKAAGLTQHDLAFRAKIAQSSLADIERGATKVSTGPTVLRLAEALNCSPEWLSSGKGGVARPIESDIDDAEAVQIYRALSPPLRKAWMASGRALMNQSGPTTANPYPKVRVKA